MKNPNTFAFIILVSLVALIACDKGDIIVATGEVTDVLPTTATVSGNVLSVGDGIKQYGHCYSKTPGSTIADSKTEYYAAIGNGTYTSFLQGLEPDTRYYVKAYGRRDNTVAYGSEISFMTSSSLAP